MHVALVTILEHHDVEPVSKFFLLGSVGSVLYNLALVPHIQHLRPSIPFRNKCLKILLKKGKLMKIGHYLGQS